MGSVAKRPDGMWRARVRGPDGRERAKHFGTKADAVRWVNVTETALYRGTWLDPEGGKLTVKEWADVWLPLQAHYTPGTLEVTRHRLDRHVLPTFGDRQLGSVRQSEVKAWVAALSRDLKPSTVDAVFRLGSQLFRAAVTDGLVARSPFAGVRLPRRGRAQVDAPPVETLGTIAAALPARARAAVWLGAGAGLRAGEALGLTVDRVDFLRRTIRVDRQLQTHIGAGTVLCAPKTPASMRTVPIGASVVDVLAAHVAAWGTGPDGLLLVTSQSQPWRRASWARVWRAAAGPGLRFHDLRHFYASLLIHSGQSAKVIQARLGHASISETYDTYGHLWPDDDDGTRAAVDDVLAGLEVRAKSAESRTLESDAGGA